MVDGKKGKKAKQISTKRKVIVVLRADKINFKAKSTVRNKEGCHKIIYISPGRYNNAKLARI